MIGLVSAQVANEYIVCYFPCHQEARPVYPDKRTRLGTAGHGTGKGANFCRERMQQRACADRMPGVTPAPPHSARDGSWARWSTQTTASAGSSIDRTSNRPKMLGSIGSAAAVD